MEAIEELVGFVFDRLAELSEQLSEITTWIVTGLLVTALEGRHLTPGKSPNSGQQLQAIIENYQRERPPENSWPLFLHLCELSGDTSRRVLQQELDRINAIRVREGKAPIDGGEDDFSAEQVVDPAATEEQRQFVKQTIDGWREAGVFELQESLKGGKRFVQSPTDDMLLLAQRHYVGWFRDLARVGVARMYFAHLDGQEEEVVRAFDQSLASIDPVALQGGLIERLVAVSARDLLLEEVRRELVEAPLSLSSMQRLATLMDSTVLPPIALTVEVERLVVLDVIARVYTDDGRGNGMLIPHLVGELGEQQDSFLESVLANNRTMGRAFITHFFMHERFPSKRETTDRCHRYFDRMARWLSLTPSQRDQDDGNPGDILEEARTQYDLAMGISVAPLDRLSGVLLKTRTRESATRAMLAIEMYRAERGDLPDSLGNLVPKYLREIPLDAYAEPEPLRYSRKAGGYLLYSVGADRKDDGGTPPSDPNEAYLPRTVRGVDAVFSDVKK